MYSPETIERLTAINSSLPAEARRWREALLSGDYVSALALIEAELSEAPHELEARLWWVRCQLEGSQLPLGALTSPLEEIFEGLREASALHAVACKTFLLLGVRLLERGQARLALLMLERADEFCSDGSVGVEERTCVRQALLKSLDAELDRSRTRLENHTYIKELEDKKRLVEQRPAAKVKTPKLRSPAKKNQLLSSKSIMEGAVGVELATQSAVVDANAQPDFPPRDELPQLTSDTPQSRSSRKLSMGIGVVGVLLLGIGAWQWRGHSAGESLRNLAMQISAIESRHVKMPPLTPVVPTIGSRDFDALQSRLDKLASGKHEPGTDGSVAEPQNIAALMKSPDIDSDALKGSSSLPPIGEAVSSEANAMEPIGPSRSEIAAKTPMLDPDRLSQLPVEDAGSSPRVGSLKQPYVRGSDGRLYGPSVATGRQAPDAGAKALDGTPLKAYEVEQFSDPIFFKIIAPTDVLDAPSSLATAVGKLEANAKVQVVSRMGNWLELRSTGGKRGYIYAQDAVEVQ